MPGPQYSSTVEEIVAMLHNSENKIEASMQYLRNYPCQAAESGFLILAVSVLKNPQTPQELVAFTQNLLDQVTQLLD